MRSLVLVALLACSRSQVEPAKTEPVEPAKTPPADRVFVLEPGVRCTDVDPGSGVGASEGTRVTVTTTVWMETSPADLMKAYPVSNAVLSPAAFDGTVGKAGKRGHLLDEILGAGPQPMRAGGRRRCAAPPKLAGMLADGIPGWSSETDLVVEVRIDKFL